MSSFTQSSRLNRLSLFSLVMITVGSVDSIRNLPATALFGAQLIVFFFLGAIFFLIPCALISAELASSWPKQGGVYIWVKEAFGDRIAFLAIWFQWIENVIWYPTILSFVAGTVGYLISPDLAQSKTFLVSTILVSFWGATFVNLLGMKSSARFSNLCSVAGLLVPMTLIISLGVAWHFNGGLSHINFSLHSMAPQFHNPNMWVSLTGIILSFCGVEIATVHAGDVENPQKQFPQALMYSIAIILSTLVLGSLSIAVVLPTSDISLVAGIMQAFEAFFGAYGLSAILPLVAVMLILGGLGTVSNWIIAPTKGLLVAAEDGFLPPRMLRVNRYEAPATILVGQAVIVSALTGVFMLMPSVNGSYWLLTALAAQLYMFMYILMFSAAICLRFTKGHVERPFKVPGGKFGLTFVSVLGLLGCLVTVAVGFIPPGNIDVGGTAHYESLLLTGLVLMCLPPFLSFYRSTKWLAARPQQVALDTL